MVQWQLLVISLTGPKPAVRMRVWRGLRSAGAAALRDGVYLLPAQAGSQCFEQPAAEVQALGGTAYRFSLHTDQAAQTQRLQALFDRTELYAAWQTRYKQLEAQLDGLSETAARRQLTQLRREFNAVTEIDFFPGALQAQHAAALQALAGRLEKRFSADEPHAQSGPITPHQLRDFQGRLWATRKHLWVDRVASAWLIQRFIDPQARFLWLDSPQDCPSDALGFDFDGAAFTHVGDKVTFEVLMESFALHQDAALRRLAALVHYLDVGGTPCAEADGFAAIMAGARNRQPDDDALLAQIGQTLDNLYSAFSET